MKERNPKYSVVITAHNAAEYIADCLSSLRGQIGIQPGDLEVVLVDDRSQDSTARAAQFIGLESLQVIRQDSVRSDSLTARQQALDIGIRSARGAVVLLMDADGKASSDWVRSMAGPIESESVDAAAGQICFRPVESGIAGWQTVDAAYYFSWCSLLNRLGYHSGVFFGNFAFKRELYEKTGGFDRIGFALTEDLAFARALKSIHARLFFTRNGIVEVSGSRNWPELLERAVRISSGGFSLLSFTLGFWMLLLPVLFTAAIISPATFSVPLVLRILSGMVFPLIALNPALRRRLFFKALCYEYLAIAVGLKVMMKLRRTHQIEWGGQRYER